MARYVPAYTVTTSVLDLAVSWPIAPEVIAPTSKTLWRRRLFSNSTTLSIPFGRKLRSSSSAPNNCYGISWIRAGSFVSFAFHYQARCKCPFRAQPHHSLDQVILCLPVHVRGHAFCPSKRKYCLDINHLHSFSTKFEKVSGIIVSM